MSRARVVVGFVALTACTVGAAVASLSREHWTIFAALVLLGTVVLVLNRRTLGRLEVRHILLGAVLLRFAVFWLPPTLSDDVYRFVWDGYLPRIDVAVYEHRPNDLQVSGRLADAPPELQEVKTRLNSADYFSVYPPASQYAFRAAVAVTGSELPASTYGVKAILALAELLGLILLGRLCTGASLAIYALNPLVVLETWGQAHTEALLIPFLALTLLFARRRNGSSSLRSLAAGAALGFGAMVKIYPALWLPPLARRRGLASVLGFIVVCATLALPILSVDAIVNIRESLNLYVRLFEFNAGPYYLLKEAMQISTGNDWSKQLGPMLQHTFLFSFAAYVVVEWIGPRSWRDRLRRIPLKRIMFWVLAAFLATATTIHPWYFVPLLALFAVDGTRSTAWIWLSTWTVATYLIYTHGLYWPFVWIMWTGWAVILCLPVIRWGVRRVLELRARRKARVVLRYLPHVPSARILDLGCGEGFVGSAIHTVTRSEVVYMDVSAYGDSEHEIVVYDGINIPLGDNAVDAVVLYYVLHHALNPEQVLAEAIRVCSGRVVIVESVFQTVLELRVLTLLDRFANKIRSGGAMGEHLEFRTHKEWLQCFEENDYRLEKAWTFGLPPHRKAAYILGAN